MSTPNTKQSFNDIRTSDFTMSLNRLYEGRVLDVNVTVGRTDKGTYCLLPASIVMVDNTVIKYVDDEDGLEATGASAISQEWLEQAWVDMFPMPAVLPEPIVPMSKKVGKDK